MADGQEGRGGRRRGARAGDEQGAVAVLAVVLLAALVLSASLAVDVGRVAAVSREQQGATDRAALDALVALREHHGGGQADAALHDTVRAAAAEALHTNGFSEQGREGWRAPEVVLGRVAPGSNRFHRLYPGTPDPSAPSSEPNAVQVSTRSFRSFLLALGDEEGGRAIHKSAAAASDTTAAISVGSRTASLDGGLLDTLLQALLGDDAGLALDAVSYEGLLGTSVDLELLAAEVGAGSLDELLDTSVGVGELFGHVLAALEVQAAQADDDLLDAGISGLGALDLGPSAGLGDIRLGEILAVDTTGPAGAVADVGVHDLLVASLQLAAATHDEAASCDGAGSALDLELDVLGLADACLNVIEPPVIAVGPARQGDDGWVTVAETAQLSLDLTVELDELTDATGPLGDVLDPLLSDLVDGLGGLLGTVGDALDCVLGGDCESEEEPADFTLGALTVGVRTATAETALTGAACAGDGTLDTRSEVTTADVTVDGSLLAADGDDVTLAGERQTTVGLGAEEATATLTGPFPGEATTVPEGGVTPSLELGAGDLTGTGALSAVDELVTPLTGLVNAAVLGENGVVTSALDQAGVSLGSADVRGLDVDCDARRLLPLEVGGDGS